jgi:predicted PurR-regulated permease PerM
MGVSNASGRKQLAGSLLTLLATAAAGYFALVVMAHYLALFFASVLLAVALTTLAEKVSLGGRIPHSIAVVLTLFTMLLLSIGFFWWFGPRLLAEFQELAKQVPRGLDEAQRWLQSSRLGAQLGAMTPPLSSQVPSPTSMVQSAGSFLGAGVSVLADILIFFIIGTFLAVSPTRYSEGVVQLLPRRAWPNAQRLLAATATALRRWLLARVSLMVLIAVLFGLGLLFLGIPLGFPLAVLAGVLTFIPYAGPALALIPAATVAFLESPNHALYVLLLYCGVQLIESYVFEPLVEGRAVSLPPALILMAQVASAVWLGAIGIVIATPLLVVIGVCVQVLYIEGQLAEPSPLTRSL